MTSLRRKRALRLSGKAGQRRSYRTVTRYYRHIVNVSLRIAAEAEALRILISEIEARRADLHLCCGLWQVWDPVGDRLRNARFLRSAGTRSNLVDLSDQTGPCHCALGATLTGGRANPQSSFLIEAGQADPAFYAEHPVSNVITIPSPRNGRVTGDAAR